MFGHSYNNPFKLNNSPPSQPELQLSAHRSRRPERSLGPLRVGPPGTRPKGGRWIAVNIEYGVNLTNSACLLRGCGIMALCLFPLPRPRIFNHTFVFEQLHGTPVSPSVSFFLFFVFISVFPSNCQSRVLRMTIAFEALLSILEFRDLGFRFAVL